MSGRPRLHWPTSPGSVFFGDVADRRTLRRAVQAGEIRQLARGVYSADAVSTDAQLVIANRIEIIAHFIPDALFVDRTAAADAQVTEGTMFVGTSTRSEPIDLPGLRITVRRASPLSGGVPDNPWACGLRMSSPARIVVDNLAPSRTRRGPARTLGLAELEDWLASKLIAWGDDRIQVLRTQAHIVADELEVPGRHDRIEELFGTVRNTRPARRNVSPAIKALHTGTAWDNKRVESFEALADTLAAEPVGHWGEADGLPEPKAIGEMPFWEAYLSNYIEGTEFSVDEARSIVESQQVPANRPADGHDILGTYLCVADPVGRALCSEDPEELVAQLKSRHQRMLEGRPEINPGNWKDSNNQVGTYTFVDHALVEGTIRKGLAAAQKVPRGLRRALYLMFVISEIHPFVDGNGRTARATANAELSAVGQSRILIPIIYRNEYLSGLRRLSLYGDPAAYMRVMDYAWRWTAAMPWNDRLSCEGKMIETNALNDSTDAQEKGLRLELP